jgi:hypothetical protein
MMPETASVSLNSRFGDGGLATGANEGVSAVIFGEGTFVVGAGERTSADGGIAIRAWEPPAGGGVMPASCVRSPANGLGFEACVALLMLARCGVKCGVRRPPSLSWAELSTADKRVSRGLCSSRVGEVAGRSTVPDVNATRGVAIRRVVASSESDLVALEGSASNAYVAGIGVALMGAAAASGTVERVNPSRVSITAVAASGPVARSSTA